MKSETVEEFLARGGTPKKLPEAERRDDLGLSRSQSLARHDARIADARRDFKSLTGKPL